MAAAVGRTVTLYKNGVEVDSTTTDGNGQYSFTNLDPASDYTVLLGIPANTNEFTYSFGSATVSDPAGAPVTTQGQYGVPAHVVAAVATTVTFNYNKNAVVV